MFLPIHSSAAGDGGDDGVVARNSEERKQLDKWTKREEKPFAVVFKEAFAYGKCSCVF